MLLVSLRKEEAWRERDTDTERTPRETEGRDQSDVQAEECQRLQQTACNWERGMERGNHAGTLISNF